MKQLDTAVIYTAISSMVLSLLLLVYVTVADKVGVTYFHVPYLLTLGFLSVHIVISTVRGKIRWAVVTAVWVMVCFGLLSAAATPYPIIASIDVNFELQNMNVIMSTGAIPWGQGTGFALGYSYFPGLEIIVSVFSLVSLIPQVVLLKYAGSFLCIITILFFLRVYARSSGQKACALAATLAALSPWFVVSGAYMAHQTPALLFVGMVLISLAEPRRREWMFVALFGVVGVAITHAFTSYMLIFLLFVLAATTWHSGRETSPALPNLTKSIAVVATVVVCFWGIFVAIGYMPNLVEYVRAVTDLAYLTEPALKTITPTGSKPLWVVALTAVGLATYFFIAFGMFVRALLKKNVQNRIKMGFALAGFLIFGAFLVPNLAGSSYAPDLFLRGLIYLYLLTAPLVAEFLVRRLRGVIHGCVGFWFSRGAIVTAGLIFLVLVPVVYYAVSPGIYDRSSPKMFPADIRLSLGEWQTAAYFSRVRISAHVVYGVLLAKDFVGALGGKEVLIVSIPEGKTLLGWIQEHPRELLFLRMSITSTPDFGHVSETDLLSTLDRANILYSSGEVVILNAR